MLIQQVKNYRQNRIKLMGFACIREPPIHNLDEPAKQWQRKKTYCFVLF